MRRLTVPSHRAVWRLMLCAMLAACAAPPPPAAGFRDPAAPIYSNAVTAPESLAGRWQQVAEFAAPGAPACAAGSLELTAGAPGQIGLEGVLCRDGRPLRLSGPAEVTGPGRLRVAAPTGPEAWWLLWIDADRRTLVIGTPSGAFGMILDRDTALPPDRAQAAREILAWNGYDLARLRPLRP